MRITDFLRRRPLQILLIVAWLALGTVMVVLQPNWWLWFAAVSYIIAAVYVVAEVLTWRRIQNQRSRSAEQKNQGTSATGGQSTKSG